MNSNHANRISEILNDSINSGVIGMNSYRLKKAFLIRYSNIKERKLIIQ